MNIKASRITGILILIFSMLITVFIISAQDTEMAADEEQAALIERGEYVAHMAGCISCHTPYAEDYQDIENLSLEQLQTLSLAAEDALDVENRAYAGGRPLELGPLGVIFTANITPDEETGIGTWTDEEIETALRIGVNPSGRRLFPLMPYRNYFNMAEDDMDALIAFLRSLEPVHNEVPRIGPTGEGIAPDLVASDDMAVSPPDGSDPVALGEYLVNTIMSCGDCHTPIDQTTGAPVTEEMLSGGQPWEGPWGIVYAGNITPHDEAGIGTWTDEEIERALTQGVRMDGRRLILMPWQDYRVATEEDIEAIIAYLRTVPAIENEAPAPSIADEFIVFEEE